MASDDECYDYDYEDDYDVDGGEEEEGDLLEEDTPAPERPADCWAITKQSLLAAQQQELSMVMNLLNVKQHHARALLTHHRWKMDCICDHLDRKGRDRILREAGVVLQENNGARAASPSGLVACYVCYDEYSPSAVSAMECGHCFCNGCWTEYFKNSVEKGKKQIRCMGEKCSIICDEAVVQRLLGDKYADAARRLDHYVVQLYVDDNDLVKWCPSVPHCGRAIRVGAGERYCEVECPCGASFCFNCAADAHSPCPCAMWEMWGVKCNGESENMNWILANTKSCPKCFKPIEKNGGCNLVTCRCGQYLCWLCGGATGSEHDMNSIAGHSCNRFVSEEKRKEVDDAKRQLQRYTHYYDRFKIHGDSYEVERETLGAAIEERVRRLEADDDRILVRDAAWLAEAHRRLLRSRQVLSRSYVFAYYMFGDGDGGGKAPRTRPAVRGELGMAKVLFEDHQEQLERNVERLSKALAADVPALPEAEILLAKQEANNLARIVRTHCGEIYMCIQEELLPLLVDAVHIAAYRPRGPDKAKEFPG